MKAEKLSGLHAFVRQTLAHHGLHQVHTALVADLIYGLQDRLAALEQAEQPVQGITMLTDEQIAKALGFSEYTTESTKATLTSIARAIEAEATAPLLARIAELEKELETERMRLAACGVVALANTRESAEKARQMHSDYMSASCLDVMRAVDAEIGYREVIAELEANAKRERERCAVEAWNHYMDTCKKTGRSPAMWHEWCAADAIRAMKEQP